MKFALPLLLLAVWLFCAELRAEVGKLPYWTDNDVHSYADAAACENGGGETKYLPQGVSPNAPEAKEIPREWAGKRITWDNQNKRWLVGGSPTKRGWCSKSAFTTRDACLANAGFWSVGYPEIDTAVDNARNLYGNDLKCDRVEYVNSGCVPYAKLYQKDVDGIRWSAIFRRRAAPVYTGAVSGMTNPASSSAKWNDQHAAVYYNIDVGGYNLRSRAGTWLDTLKKGGSGPGANDNRYDIGFVLDPANTFPGNTGSMPRPGGLRPWTRNEGAHASRWWDTTAMLRSGECTECHGGFFNGTDALVGTGHSLGTYDDDTYWHAGNHVLGFTPRKFFRGARHLDTGANTGSCTSCHSNFMQNPTGELTGILDFMTGKLNVINVTWSDWRLHKSQADIRLKDARITHAMPKGHGWATTGTHKCSEPIFPDYLSCIQAGKTWTVDPGPGNQVAKTWLYNNAPAVEMIKCCTTGSTSGKCSRVQCEDLRDAPIPKMVLPFQKASYQASGTWPLPWETQEIRPPDRANALSLSAVQCPEPKPLGWAPGDLCYRLSWEDPTGSPFNAPREYYWNVPTPSNGGVKGTDRPDWFPSEKNQMKYCIGVGGNAVPRTTETQLTTQTVGNRWRFAYTSVGLLKKCTKMAVQFCGGWCAMPSTLNMPATDEGTFLTVANAPAGCPTQTPSPTATPTPTPAPTFPLKVYRTGNGAGTVNSNPGGILCGNDCDESYPAGTQVTLAAWPQSGSSFVRWTGACSGTSANCTVTMSQARDVTAVFDSASNPVLTVTKSGTGNGVVNSVPAGIDCGFDCNEAYAANRQVTVTAWPQSGSSFLGWTGACNGASSSCTILMSASKSVNAQFGLPTPTPTPTASPTPAAKYTLSVLTSGNGLGIVNSNPSGIDCGADCSEAYNANIQVTLAAWPQGGSGFAGWGGACSDRGTNPTCTVMMSAARSVTATFAVNNSAPQTLTVQIAGNGNGVVNSNPAGIGCATDCQESYPINTAVTLRAWPQFGTTFTGWSGACQGTNVVCTLGMNEAKSVTATFTSMVSTPAPTASPGPSGFWLPLLK